MARMGSRPAPWVNLPRWIYIWILKGIPTYSEWLALFDILRLKSLNSCLKTYANLVIFLYGLSLCSMLWVPEQKSRRINVYQPLSGAILFFFSLTYTSRSNVFSKKCFLTGRVYLKYAELNYSWIWLPVNDVQLAHNCWCYHTALS